MGAKFNDITGRRFGMVTANYYVKHEKKRAIWSCTCDCGKVFEVKSNALLTGNTKSCGCQLRVKAIESIKAKAFVVHHMRSYSTWNKMIHRCTNEKSSDYHHYGGRGIKVCDRWLEFRNFLEDMGDRPEGLTLDRIDVNGNYEPSNCRWADNETQGNNRRNNKRITIEETGEELTVTQLARRVGVKQSAMFSRYNRAIERTIKEIEDRMAFIDRPIKKNRVQRIKGSVFINKNEN